MSNRGRIDKNREIQGRTERDFEGGSRNPAGGLGAL